MLWLFRVLNTGQQPLKVGCNPDCGGRQRQLDETMAPETLAIYNLV